MNRISKASLCFLFVFVLLLTGCSSSIEVTTEEEAAKTTVETKTEEPKVPDPAADDVLNVLMIGNSGCTYFPDEICGMAKDAGIKMRVSALYYSGCRLVQHWEWYKGNEYQYTLYTNTTEIEERSGEKASLKSALEECDWDVISLQQALGPRMTKTYDNAMKETRVYAVDLYRIVKEYHPKAKFLWHEFWAFEVGFNKPDGLGVLKTVDDQNHQATVIRQVADSISEICQVPIVPTGSAWTLARKNGSGDLTKDLLHDGETQGGQMLNASVWFEVLTGKSCLTNNFKPKYDLSEDRIALLKYAAHQTVADLYGADFAK
jgi:hypothetical protein